MKDLLLDKLSNCSGFMKTKAAWIWFVAQENPDLDMAKDIISAVVNSENVEGSDVNEACENDLEILTDEFDAEMITKCVSVWKEACGLLWIQSLPSASGLSMTLSECLIILGGDPLDESKLTLFNYKKKQWYDLKAPAQDLGHRYAICALGSMLYLSGGLKKPKAFLCYQNDSKMWTEQAELPTGREQHCMCTLPVNSVRLESRMTNQKIYVLGGTSQNQPCLSDVHVYDAGRMSWEVCGNISNPVTGACCAVVEKRIYLFGGAETNSGSKSPSDLIQVFDTETRHGWKIEVKLPVKAKAQKMGVVHEILTENVFVVHGGKIHKVELGKKKQSIKETISIKGAPVKGFGCSSYGNRIFIYGGEDDNFRISKNIFQFDTVSGQTITLPSHTPFPMKDFTCCDILVPDSWDLTEYPSC